MQSMAVLKNKIARCACCTSIDTSTLKIKSSPKTSRKNSLRDGSDEFFNGVPFLAFSIFFVGQATSSINIGLG